jgi:hypothetical protein
VKLRIPACVGDTQKIESHELIKFWVTLGNMSSGRESMVYLYQWSSEKNISGFSWSFLFYFSTFGS